jgi:hypothetical protein
MGLSLNLIADADEILYNRRVKINPLNGEVLEDVCSSRPIFNPQHAICRRPDRRYDAADFGEQCFTEGAAGDLCEDAAACHRRDEHVGGNQSAADEAVKRAAARARKQLFELCACNDFDLFFTLTLDKERIDRYDYKEAVKKLSQWFDNRVRRRGLRYVAVPEYHKDGAIHFHGLCNSEACRLVDSGRKDKGHAVYNLSDWNLGFTTAIKLYGERNAAAHYVAKYVTKSTACGTIGGRYYFHGGDLQKARCVYYHEDFGEFAGRELTIDAAGLTFKYAR